MPTKLGRIDLVRNASAVAMFGAGLTLAALK
jgi:hypothetical protein